LTSFPTKSFEREGTSLDEVANLSRTTQKVTPPGQFLGGRPTAQRPNPYYDGRYGMDSARSA
jgi:hypothetical protein